MSKYCFGVDVGGTTVKMGLFDLEGNVQEKWEIVTRTEDNGKNILPDVAKSVLDKMTEKNIAKADVAGIGIGVPGPVNDKGVVLKAVNLGWGIMDVNEILGGLTGLAVQAGNDANVAALGEMWRGGGQGFQNMVLVTLGTGVGGGVILGGRILTGATGAAGEIGHIHIEDKEADTCGCGNHGCLEQYASATGVVRIAKKLLAASKEESSLRTLETVTAKDVFDAAKTGDHLAVEAVEVLGKYLGLVVANVALTVDPDVFVIGGGVSKAGQVLIDVITKYYHKFAKIIGDNKAKVVLAKLGNDAGIYGAARMVLK